MTTAAKTKMNLPGTNLTITDLERLARGGIPADLARQAFLRRVTSVEGSEIVGRNGAGDYAGICFPYCWPGQFGAREYRLRRDSPDLEYKNGRLKEKDKYLSPPGRGNLLYLVPGTIEEWLGDTSIPVVIVEGEKKTLAAWTLAWRGVGDASDHPQFLPIGLPGVWGWRSVIGKTPGPDGGLRSVKGVIDDFNKIAWEDRKVIIAFDTNLWTNESVQHAHSALTDELKRRGAKVHHFQWPANTPKSVNGIDDMIAEVGLDQVLALIESAPPADSQPADWEDPIPLQSRVVPAIQPEWIPGVLGDMVRAVASATETPLEMAALLGIAVASSCVAKKVIVQVEPGYAEPVNLYAAPAMESGNRKTAVVNYMTKPLVDWERREAKRLEPEIKRAASRRKTAEARITHLRARAAKSKSSLNTTIAEELADMEASLEDIPPSPRLWLQDMTVEILAVEMQAHGERMAIFSDEGGLFDILAGRYTNKPNLDLINQAHSGSPARVNRISRPPVFLRSPVLTIGISPQPDVLARLSDTPQFRGRGLLARFLYALPVSPLGTRSLDRKPCPDDVLDTYEQLIERLLRLSPPESEGICQPWTLNFSGDAYRAWKQFQREVESMMKERGKLDQLRDWASKLPGAVARLAGVFHAVVVEDLTRNLVISRDTTDCAISLGTALIDHALAVFDLMERDPTFEGGQKILEWIRRDRRQTFTLRECFHAHQRRFKRVVAIRPALALLVEHGHLRRAFQASVPNRPSEIFEVNPWWLKEST